MLVQGGHVRLIHRHLTGVRLDQSQQQPSQRAFAAAALAHQRQRFAAVDGQVHVGNGLHAALARLKGLLQMLCLKQYFLRHAYASFFAASQRKQRT